MRLRLPTSQLFQDIKYVLLIVRNGLDKIQRWLPYLKPDISMDFINQRYNLKLNKPATHKQEYKQLQELVYASIPKNEAFFVSKAVLLPEISGLEITEINEKQLEFLFQQHLSWIKNYLSFLIAAHQEPIIIVYRFRKNGQTLKSQLTQVKKYVHLISYDQLSEKATKYTVFMLEPYLVKEEDLAKFVISKIASITNKIEYFQIRFQANLKHLQFEFIYPNIYQNVELKPNSSTYKRRKSKERKRIVYFDYEDNQDLEITQKQDYLSEGRTSKEHQQYKSSQTKAKQSLQQTKQIVSEPFLEENPVKIQNMLSYTSFNIFSNQAKQAADYKCVQSAKKTKNYRFK